MGKNRRLELHNILCELLGSSNVYFQPPETIKMKYPAIVYELNDIESKHADDGVYLSKREYLITLIDKDPDNEFVGKVSSIPTCRFNRHYQSDNLNHYVFTVFY